MRSDSPDPDRAFSSPPIFRTMHPTRRSFLSVSLLLLALGFLPGCGTTPTPEGSAAEGMPAPLPGPGGEAQPPSGEEANVCFPLDALSPVQRSMADSLLARGLENEALYTLLSHSPEALPLKPISTLDQRRGELARDPSAPAGLREAMDPANPVLAELAELHAVVSHLHCGPVRVVVVPFRATQERIRSVQLLVTHQGTLDQALARAASFWGQWGFTPGADPGTVVTVVEFEESGPRFRGYGYLFGYPEHAVSFFVEAAEEMARTGDFVERDFFQLPVHSGETGRFVYAVPKGHDPLPEDLAIREEAERVLARYRTLRPRFENGDGTLRAVELLRAWRAEVTASGSR